MRTATHNSTKLSSSSSRAPSPRSPERRRRRRRPKGPRDSSTRLGAGSGLGTREKGARLEIAAGGIVWKESPAGPLIAFILDPFGKWTFAKGHVRRARGESLALAALRETEEETGLRGLRLQDKLGTTSIWFRDQFEHPGALVHKYITYYLMQAARGARGKPQKKELIRGVEWVPLEEAVGRSSYANTRPVLARAIRIIKRIGYRG